MVRLRQRDGRNPEELAEMDLKKHLGDKVLKEKYVKMMFDVLAPGYDSFTQIFSFGMDRAWKNQLIEEGAQRASKMPCIVDLACGTGDFAVALALRTGAKRTIGLDFSIQMLREAKRRLRNKGCEVHFMACDMLRLCIRDHSIDIVSIGYGIRNTSDFNEALREVARVLKPGGILINLDFYKPVNRVWRKLFLWYIWHAGRVAGWLWHREPIVYGYLAPSIRGYLTIPEFESALKHSGFRIEWRESRLGGGIGLHVAKRMGDDCEIAEVTNASLFFD